MGKAEGGICLGKESLDVFENSEGARPRSPEVLFARVSLLLNIFVQLMASRVLVSESLRSVSASSGIDGVLLLAKSAS